MRLNLRSITDLVYQILVLDGHLAPSLPKASVVSLAQAGGVFGSAVTVTPRRVLVGVEIRPSTLLNRQAVMDSIKRRLQRGLLELTTDDLPGRVLRVTADEPTVELYTGAYAQATCYVGLSFTAADPTRHDVEPLVYGLATTRTPCPLGTETVAPRVWIYGGSPSVANPVVLVRDHTGTEVSRLTLTGTLATNDALLIDAATQSVDRYVSGVLQTGSASGLSWVTSGRFPLLDPTDVNADAPAWGTIELSATSGTPTGLIAYHRRW